MDPRVESVINIMREGLGDHLCIRMLSKSVNLSPARLRQLFKRDTGRSPMEYLGDVRMRHAEHLLRNTFLSIKEVAFGSGVKHVSSFVHAFKKRHGLTPREFRALRERPLYSVAAKGVDSE